MVTVVELAALLRQLRRREARRRGGAVLTYRELAARTGWSRTVIGSYLAGDTLPPTDRFDALVRLLGASAVEQGQLATARDRVEDRRRAEAVPVPDEAARAATAAHDGPVTGGQVVPRQLPAAARAFAGRHAELRTLTTLAGSAAGRADGAVVAVIDGAAGIGKTALAVHAAHRVATQFPDGQLYVDLRGFAPAGAGPVRGLTPGEAVRGFLDALAVPVARLPATASALTGLYRSLLADRRLLVLLDNAADADQVRPLLPGTPGCLVVVTSRNRLTGLVVADGAEAVRLGPLTAGEGHALLIGRLGPERVAAERPAVDDIVRRCAGLPLALSIVAARAATAPRFPLAVLAGDLQDARQGLDALDAGEPSADLRSVLSWSVRELDAPAARLFRLLGLHSGADIGVAAAASLAGLPQRPVRRALAELCQVNLLAEHAPGRYSSHDLVRAYARELAHAQDPAPDRLAAVRRLLDHYLLTAFRAAMTLDPHRAPIAPAAAAPGAAAERPADYAAALAWLAAEHPALLGAVDLAAEVGADAHTWQLAWTLATFLDRQGRWQDLGATHRAGLAAARRLADRPAQARAHAALGRAHTMLGDRGDAHANLGQALHLYAELGDRAGLPCVQSDLACLLDVEGRYAEALGHAEVAFGAYRAAGHRTGHARAISAIGRYHARLGAVPQALACGQRARRLQQRSGDARGEAATWENIGLAHHRRGDHGEAAACYQTAAGLFEGLGDRYYEAAALRRVARAGLAAGEPGPALLAGQKALVILERLGHPEAGAVRTELAGVGVAGMDSARHQR